jgi:hypothetical protein
MSKEGTKMTTSATPQVPPNGNDEQGDDLTRITGIAETRQQWLKSIGINTFQKLADASVDALDSELKARGDNVSTSEIEGWIAQARELAAELPSPTVEASQEKSQQIETPAYPTEESEASQPTVSPPQTETESPSGYPTEATEAEESSQQIETGTDIEVEATSETVEEEWTTFASFAVEFQSKQVEGGTQQQTTVRHVQTNAIKKWMGIESDAISQWIRERVSKAIPSDAGTESLTAKTPITVEIDRIRVFQPPRIKIPMTVDRVSQAFSHPIRRDESFSLEVHFNLNDLNTTDLARQQVTSLAQFYTRYWSTGETTNLGNAESKIMSQEKPPYAALLSGTSLQQPGLYRLQVLVTLQGIPATPGYFEVPLLQVV